MGRPRTRTGPDAEYQRRHALAWYYANKDRGRANAIRRNRANSAMIRAIKAERGCADCDYGPDHPRWHPDVIEFDHRPGVEKFRDIADMVGYAPERIREEIAKCDAVCANCHRLRTALRRELDQPTEEMFQHPRLWTDA